MNDMKLGYLPTKKGKLLIIDVDQLDFVDNPEDLGFVIDRIDAQINGLF
jgi:deoxyadenosine/deoxycytidine kinase